MSVCLWAVILFPSATDWIKSFYYSVIKEFNENLLVLSLLFIIQNFKIYTLTGIYNFAVQHFHLSKFYIKFI